MIVVTLSKVPDSLRGDLTQWCQEIQTGIYVGNPNAKIRDLLWQRICQNIGSGEATLVYSVNNELGYGIKTNRKDCQVRDYDGLPFLVHLATSSVKAKPGFSKAAKFRKIELTRKKKLKQATNRYNFVVLDIETTGLNLEKDQILSIGAVRVFDNTVSKFYREIKVKKKIPTNISKLTGLTNNILNKEGVDLDQATREFIRFIKGLPLLGYNINFDINFLEKPISGINRLKVNNEVIDLMSVVKKNEKFLDDYQLSTVLHHYNILNEKPHQALSDAKATYELALKLLKNGNFHL